MVDSFIPDNFDAVFTIFHNDYPVEDTQILRRGTKRKVDFYNIDWHFNRPPISSRGDRTIIDLYKDDPNWSKRGKWNYQNMIRFWFQDIFEIYSDVQYFIRLDDDSKFLVPCENFFQFL